MGGKSGIDAVHTFDYKWCPFGTIFGSAKGTPLEANTNPIKNPTL